MSIGPCFPSLSWSMTFVFHHVNWISYCDYSVGVDERYCNSISCLSCHHDVTCDVGGIELRRHFILLLSSLRDVLFLTILRSLCSVLTGQDGMNVRLRTTDNVRQ